MGTQVKKIFIFSLVAMFSKVLFAIPQDLQTRLDEMFADFDSPSVPGASVTVIQDESVLIQKSYGLQNLEKKEKTTTRTHYRLASLTKQFTAMGVLILVDQGKIILDENLKTIFPDFPIYGKEIRIRHLLQHTSGLIDYEDLIPQSQTEPVSDDDVLTLMKGETRTYFKPGSQYRYSNSGYCILSKVIEARSETSFRDFLRVYLFERAGMHETEVYEEGKSVIPERAYGYTYQGSGFKRTDQSMTSLTQGDGGIYTSVEELLFWERALNSEVLVPKSLIDLMFTRGKLNDGSQISYGMGWVLDSYRGLFLASHTGSTIGFRTGIMRFPQKRTTVAVLVNRANASPIELCRKIIDLVLFNN